MDASLSRKGMLEVVASLGAFAATAQSAFAQDAERESVVGAWSLESFVIDEGKESEKPRFGPDPVGYLLYTQSGRMAAVLGGIHRSALEPPPSKVNESCASSVADFLAYAGRYEIKGDHVLHHVEVSVFTNLIGSTLERRFTLKANTLTIHTLPPEIWGTSSLLVWKRS